MGLRPLRLNLKYARGFAGTGLALHGAITPARTTFAWYAMSIGADGGLSQAAAYTTSAVPVSAVAFSASADAQLRSAHRALRGAGVHTNMRRLQAAEGLVYGGLGLELLGIGLAFGLPHDGPTFSDDGAAIAMMLLGNTASVTGNALMLSDAHNLRRLGAGLSFGPDGHVNGAVTVDFQ